MLPIPNVEEVKRTLEPQEFQELEIVYAHYGRDLAVNTFLERYIQLRMENKRLVAGLRQIASNKYSLGFDGAGAISMAEDILKGANFSGS